MREILMRHIISILLVLFLIILAAVVPVLLVLGPELDIHLLFPKVNVSEPQQNESIEPVQDEDMERYFELKNISCKTLTRDFLIVTDDYSDGRLHNILPVNENETTFAQNLADEYDFNMTTKTYLRRDQMKKVLISDGEEFTTIWKNGRIYTCTDSCQMHLMDENESEEYYNTISRFRNNCRHFGKTELPDSVNLTLLFDINKTGVEQINGYTCERFLIAGNRSYISALNVTLDPDQEALLWALEHLDGPVMECLDESTGIIVQRNFTLDLSDSYDLEFDAGGYLKVHQLTTLTYFTDDVPWEFFALPS
jgi:hypothetical protein